jgi:hypothetical protein
MNNIPEDIQAMFSQDELSQLKSNTVAFGGDRSDPIKLAAAWDLHVAKIDADRALPSTDRSVWNEHDLAGALFIRDRLETALNQLAPSLRDRMLRYVTKTDEQFRSFTIDDPRKRMAKIADIDPEGRPWWWFRVPVSGPIVEDLAKY